MVPPYHDRATRMASDRQDDEGLPEKRPRRPSPGARSSAAPQIIRRRLVAVGSIVVVAVAVVIVLSSAEQRRLRRQGVRQRAHGTAAHKPAAESKPETTEVRNATPQPGWKPYTGPVPILEYHVLGAPARRRARTPNSTSAAPTSPSQMDWLDEHGYQAVTLEQVQEAWYHGGTLPPKPSSSPSTTATGPSSPSPCRPCATRLGGSPQPQGRRLGPLRIERQGDDRRRLGAGRPHRSTTST